MTDDTIPPFEAAYERLEAILKQMNSGDIVLDKALKLYEEADQLIAHCNKRLADAETRIETLIKDREGALALDEDGRPQIQTLTSP